MLTFRVSVSDVFCTPVCKTKKQILCPIKDAEGCTPSMVHIMIRGQFLFLLKFDNIIRLAKIQSYLRLKDWFTTTLKPEVQFSQSSFESSETWALLWNTGNQLRWSLKLWRDLSIYECYKYVSFTACMWMYFSVLHSTLEWFWHPAYLILSKMKHGWHSVLTFYSVKDRKRLLLLNMHAKIVDELFAAAIRTVRALLEWQVKPCFGRLLC